MAGKSLKLYVLSVLGTLAVGALAYNAGWFDRLNMTSGQGGPGEAITLAEPAAVETEAGPETGSGSGSTERESAPAAAVVAPSFDVVRVETDGNVLIAGSALAGSDVEIITGNRILGKGESNADGDFVVILEEALAAGDYSIVLRATSPDGVVAMSAETAIVSIPESPEGEVLAIVDEPGKPTKLITVAGTERETGSQETAGAGDEAVEQEVAGAMPDRSPGPAAQEPVVLEPAAQEPAAASAEVGPAADVPGASASDAPSAASRTEDVAVADSSSVGEELAATTPDASGQADETAVISTEAREDEVANAPAAAPEAAAAPDAEPEPAQPETPAAQPGKPVVAVEAVEIEGDHVFIAGRAEGGKIVRVYANKDLIGEALVSEAGRFLVESTQGLAEGDYIIRADLLALGSADVIARAAVPFERTPGELLAAVAPELSAAASAGQISAQPSPAVRERADEDAAAQGGEEPAAMPSVAAGQKAADSLPAQQAMADGRDVPAQPDSRQADRPATDADAQPKDATEPDAVTEVASAAPAETSGESPLPSDEPEAAIATPEMPVSITEGPEEVLPAAEVPAAEMPEAAQEDAAAEPVEELPARAGDDSLPVPSPSEEQVDEPRRVADEAEAASTPEPQSSAIEEPEVALPAGEAAAEIEAEIETEAAAAAESEPEAEASAAADEAADAGSPDLADGPAGEAPEGEAVPMEAQHLAKEESAPAAEEAAQPAVAEEPRPAAEDAHSVTDEDMPTAAPLQPSPASVIIRRGDTLWQISRRVYGRGIRYTTIYGANADQIEDPDRIWPGQVFEVPAISEDGNPANFDAISDRLGATTPDPR